MAAQAKAQAKATPAKRKVSAAKNAPAKRKPAARKAASVKKTVFTRETIATTLKEAVYAQLGVYGMVYDSVNDLYTDVNGRVSKARKVAPKQWKELVKRGEKVEKDLRKTQTGLQKRIDRIDLKSDLDKSVDKVRVSIEKMVDRIQKAA